MSNVAKSSIVSMFQVACCLFMFCFFFVIAVNFYFASSYKHKFILRLFIMASIIYNTIFIKMDFPLACLSFSPNWFLPQIVQCDKNFLIYGSNDSVFIFNHQNKLYHAQINPGGKITVLFIEIKNLFVGHEGGVITIYDLNFQPPKFKGKIELNMKSIHFFQPKVKSPDTYIVFDERGIGIQFSLKDYSISHFQVKVLNQPSDKPKFLYQFSDGLIAFYEKGLIYTSLEQTTKYPFNILYVHSFQDQRIALLSKRKSQIGLHIIEFKDSQQLQSTISHWNQFNDSLPIEQQLFVNERYFILRILQNDGLPKLEKASLTAIWLDLFTVLVSSKQGEFYTICWRDKPEIKFQEIILHPQALNQETSGKLISTKLPLDLHYKSIFLADRYLQHIYTAGIDRRINMMLLNDDNELESYWKISLLGAKVNKLSLSSIEPNLIYFSDTNSGLKCLDLAKKHDGCYVNEFWKGIPIFEQFEMHPEVEGLAILISSEKKINLWDVYKETLVCSISVGQTIAKIICLSDSMNLITLMKLLVENPTNTPTSVQFVVSDKKYLRRKYKLGSLVIITATASILILDLDNVTTLFEGKVAEALNVQTILGKHSKVPEILTIRTQLFAIQESPNKTFILCVVNDNLIVTYHFDAAEQKLLDVDVTTVHTQITCADVKCVENNIYVVTGGNDKNVGLFAIKNEKLILIGFLKHRYPIQRVSLDGFCNVFAIARQHQTLQVWNVFKQLHNVPKIDQHQYIEDTTMSCNIRGHNGFVSDAMFYPLDKNIVVTCSEDQTIKVWDVTKIPNQLPPNKKKGNKKQNNKKRKLNTGTQAIQKLNKQDSDQE